MGLVPIWAAHGHIWRGESGEVGGIGKESPSGAGWDGQSLCLMEGVEFHEEKNASRDCKDTPSMSRGGEGLALEVWGDAQGMGVAAAFPTAWELKQALKLGWRAFVEKAF